VRRTLLAALGLIATGATDEPRAPDLPLFVVERSRVVWPRKCARAGTPVPAEVRSEMRKQLGERGVLVGAGRADEIMLGAPECMPGECGSGQFAVPLASSDAQRTGLFLPASSVAAASLHPLKLVSAEGAEPHGLLRPGLPPPKPAPPPCGDPPPEPRTEADPDAAGRLVTCLTYLESSGPRGIQIQGRGELRGNGSPAYDLVRFRTMELREGKAVPGAWHAQPRGEGSRLPEPVALLPGASRGEIRVLWLREEGICCPSAASAWVTDVGDRATDGPRHVGGLGQPCD
jgi:hypothetical protein